MPPLIKGLIILSFLLCVRTVNASELCGSTDYLSELTEWHGNAGTTVGQWAETSMSEHGITYSYSSTYNGSYYRIQSAPGYVSMRHLNEEPGATQSLSISLPVTDSMIENVFGDNSGTYIQETELYFEGLRNNLESGQSISVWFGGWSWPMAATTRFFSDAIRINEKDVYPCSI